MHGKWDGGERGSRTPGRLSALGAAAVAFRHIVFWDKTCERAA
jgi:hypothetical protein